MRKFTQTDSRIKMKTIIDVSFSPLTDKIEVNNKCLSLVDQWHSDQKPEGPNHGVLDYFTIEEAVVYINDLPQKTSKNNAPNFLKGLYEGGTGGRFCKKGSNLLFYDIDVKRKKVDKKGENEHLFDPKLNSDVFDYLKTISLFVFRSYSGHGIAGALYVPFLQNLLIDKKSLHKRIGDEICSELTRLIYNEINIKVQFDSKQNTFRQLRKVYPQEAKVKLNRNPIQVNVKVKEEEHVTHAGVPMFKNDYGYKGGIRYQFNENTSIEDALLLNGFFKISDNRWHNPASSSASTGQVNFESNTFYSHSSSFGEGLYTPFDIHAIGHGMTGSEFNNYLKTQLNYKIIPVGEKAINLAVESLNNDNLGSQDIFDLCSPLLSLSIPERYDFVKKLNANDTVMNHVYEYLKIVNLDIKYDYEVKFDDFLSGSINQIMGVVDNSKKVCVAAGTGYGKTRAFIEYFKSKTESKTIFLAPLQSIVEQTSKDFNIPYLTGDSSALYHSRVKISNIFAATYEQGVKHMETSDFDYVIIDEFHNIYTSNNYREVLAPLAYLIKKSKSKIIGLTGTPNNITRELGYTIVKCEKNIRLEREVIERFTNRNGHFTAIDHIKRHGGKCLIRINSKTNLDSIKAELVETLNYDESEVLVLFSDRRVKRTAEYKSLIKNEHFSSGVKIVLVTGVIDEGVNIKDKDFDSVVFIESNTLNPRPEAIPQFFNRIRSHDINTRYYFYRRYSSKHVYIYLDEQEHYANTIHTLKNWKNQFEDYSTYTGVFNNDKYFLSDNSVNKPYVAYNTTLSSFQRFTPYMLDEYLKNYNITIIRDDNFKPKVIDKSFKKSWDKDSKLEIRHLWINHLDTIFSALKFEANNPHLKEALKHFEFAWEEEMIDDVLRHLKTFEKYYSYYQRLCELTDNPNDYIVGDNSLTSIQKLNNKLYKLETMSILNNPKTSADRANRDQIMSLINGLIEKGEFTRNDIDKSLESLKLINKPSYQIMDQILKQFCKLTYNKKTKTYSVKGKW
jgi:hypothetical protein